MRRDHLKEAKEQLSRSQEISQYMEIPSNHSTKFSNETNFKSYFQKYDHSLETNRLTALRKKYNYQESENPIIDPLCQENRRETTEMDTKPYENIDPSECPNLNGIFDNIFITPD